ncbi:hypothetical protein [Vibrio parahaemolyticus]|uniref:hypothetical protein n=1 Tax=Vibrio parahaemolyticus TaxID=670 RepID=UPI000465B4A8|nr:hypothetical protein [Vibrio parahaemolyticus]EHJ9961298.1 hypothetical protein [Vibrio parahaemolyticus]EHR0247431.1 hypothetical protein [Vibrio parahaemolyticus]EID0698362.1 hypothetical protein [Vibrio parahaemolyticus]EJU9123906.1 hypothetical protein [Vibrio parahaemolyticus]ELA7027607.1 hypothetical protein [Vibrio parahaemolyticus]
MISEDSQILIDTILRNCGTESMTQEEIDFANAINADPEGECECYQFSQNVLVERVSQDSNKRFTLVRLKALAEANGCSLTDKKPVVKEARIPIIGGGI